MTKRLALVGIPLAFLAIFFAYPLLTILGRGLWPGGDFDLGPVADVFESARLRGVAWFTVWQAAVSTVLTIVAALPAAYVLARYEFPGRSLVRGLFTVPFVLPTVVVGSAFLALGFTESLGAVLLAHLFFNFSVVVRTVGGLWSHLDPRQEEAARVLGASRTRAFISATLPALRPAIGAAASIVFLFTFTSFGVIRILGGPTRSTLETEIYRQTTQLLDLRTAAALSVVQLLAVIVLLLVTARIQGRRAVAISLRPYAETGRRPSTRRERTLVLSVLGWSGLVLGAPLAVLVVRSFDTADGWSLDFYRSLGELRSGSILFVPPTDAIGNSVLYAVVATLLAIAVGGLAAFVIGRTRGGLLGGALSLPLGVSAVMLGFGFLITFDEAPLDLRSSWVIVPIAHALIAIPFVIWTTVPLWRSIDPRLREAAAVLGATPRRVRLEVDLPVAARALLVAAGFAFAISLGEFGATSFLATAQPDSPTLPVMIFRLLEHPGGKSFGAAMAASTILMLLTLCAVLSIERTRAGELGTF